MYDEKKVCIYIIIWYLTWCMTIDIPIYIYTHRHNMERGSFSWVFHGDFHLEVGNWKAPRRYDTEV